MNNPQIMVFWMKTVLRGDPFKGYQLFDMGYKKTHSRVAALVGSPYLEHRDFNMVFFRVFLRGIVARIGVPDNACRGIGC